MTLWAILACLCLPYLGFTQTITVDFTNPIPAPPTSCTDQWTENGIAFSFDQSTSCFFDYSGGSFWLFPARAIMDLTAVTVDRVEIDVIDYCAIGCTFAQMVDNGAVVASATNTTSAQSEPLILQNPGGNVSEVRFESSEAEFTEIRIVLQAPPIEPVDPDVDVDDGDVVVRESLHGVVLVSPNGTCYRIRVDHSGMLMTEQVTCP